MTPVPFPAPSPTFRPSVAYLKMLAVAAEPRPETVDEAMPKAASNPAKVVFLSAPALVSQMWATSSDLYEEIAVS